MKPLLLDLFCGAGGAAVGYHRAGFNVIGVDKEPQPHYPFSFIQGDALQYLDLMMAARPDGGSFWFDAVHASPPCQAFSKMARCRPGLAAQYPNLIPPTRERLAKLGVPYVIENVPQAPLRWPVTLCGSHFGLSTVWEPHGKVGLWRHRGFESNVSIPAPPVKCDHSLRPVLVAGHGPGKGSSLRGRGHQKAAYEVMGVDWMNREELAEAIPPVFATYVGWHLRAALSLDLPPWEAEAEALATLGRAA